MAAPKLNERDRRGTKVRTLTADLTTVGQITPTQPGLIYDLLVRAVGVRLLTAQTTVPAGFSYIRRAAFLVDANKAVTQLGATDALGSTDLETDAGANITVSTDGTNINLVVTASYPCDWTIHVDTVVADQVQVG